MKDIRKTEIRVGVTVVFAVVLLLWLAGWAKNFSLTSDRIELTVKFNSVAGLEIGDGVFVSGVRKGYTEEISVKGTDVFVKLMMDEDTELKADAEFSIMMLDLMGGKKIEILPGFSDEMMDYSAIQTGEFKGDISTAMAMLSSVQNDLIEMIKGMKVSLDGMNKILADDNFAKELKSSVANLNKMVNNVDALLTSNYDQINRLLNSSAELVENGNEVLTDNKEMLKESLSGIKILVDNTNQLVTRINKITVEAEKKENNIGKILYDENILENLKSTIDQINELTNLLIDQLKGEGINVDANIF